MILSNPVPNFDFSVVLYDMPANDAPSDPLSAAAGAAYGALSPLVLAFQEVSGLDSGMEMEEYLPGGSDAPVRLHKRRRLVNLVLRRGVTFDPGLWDWQENVLKSTSTGFAPRKGGIIVLHDRGSATIGIDRTPAAVWCFHHGLPERLAGPSLNAKGNEIAIESLEIAHEGIVRLGASSLARMPGALTAAGGA